MSDANNILFLFVFQDHDIGIVIHNGEPWFVAKDVCEAPGLTNHHQVITVLSEHQKSEVGVSGPIGRPLATFQIELQAAQKPLIKKTIKYQVSGRGIT